MAEAKTSSGFGRLFGGGLPQSDVRGLAILLVALIALFSILVPDTFLTFGTAQSIMFQAPELGLLCLAMVIPLITGGLNLAIIATTNQCALLMAFIMSRYITPDMSGGETAMIIAAAVAAGFLLSLVIGLITGFLVANMNVHPILVTLGTMSVIDGISIYLTRGKVIAGLPESFQWIGNGTVAGIPVPFIILVVIAVIIGIVLTRTAFGISAYMIGSNLEATRYSGINTKRVLIGVYTLSSVLCFVTACLIMARFNSASPAYAQSYLLITILAAVLGGIDPFGGFGRIAGLMMALMVLQVISSGFNLLGLNQYLTLAIWGVTLIAVMTVKFLVLPYFSARRSLRTQKETPS
jgi:simple sugar transport system permease protein